MYLNKKHFLYLVFSLSLFIGFLFDENSSGGAKLDHEYLLPFIENPFEYAELIGAPSVYLICFLLGLFFKVKHHNRDIKSTARDY